MRVVGFGLGKGFFFSTGRAGRAGYAGVRCGRWGAVGVGWGGI